MVPELVFSHISFSIFQNGEKQKHQKIGGKNTDMQPASGGGGKKPIQDFERKRSCEDWRLPEPGVLWDGVAAALLSFFPLKSIFGGIKRIDNGSKCFVISVVAKWS